MKEPKPRGRPRRFDKDTALESIKNLFWKQGFSATSLDDIAKETNINRPSLYAAFGSKEEMYLACMDLFVKDMATMAEQALKGAPDVRAGLINLFEGAIAIYTNNTVAVGDKTEAPLGCLIACTAPSEVFYSDRITTVLQKAFAELDASFANALSRESAASASIPEGQRPLIGQMLGTLLNGIGVRARAGASAEELNQIAVHYIDCLLPPARS